MKRKNKLHYRNIKSTVYYTIRGIILLPIRLILLPFKLIGKALFYRKPKQILTLGGLRSINRRIFKNSDTISYLKKQLAHIETNLMYDNTLDEVNKRIDELDKRMLIHYKVEDKIQNNIKVLSDEIDTHMNCFNGSESSHLLYLINELQLSLESMKPKDLGTFNFISDKPTQLELAQIEAEMLGSSVAKEEYDWHCEQKAKNKQIQDRMRADEAEYDRLSEPDKDNK